MSPYCSAHDEWLIMKLCMYVRYHTANNVSNFGGDPVTQLHFITIFNVFSYLRHVKRLGICLPRGRSRSIINIHSIVTSRWWIKRFHRRRASGVRVKREAGHTSLSKALVNGKPGAHIGYQQLLEQPQTLLFRIVPPPF